MRPIHPCPPHSTPPDRCLLQRVLACEKRSVSCLTTEWRFDGMHAIHSVCSSGVPSCWQLEDGCTLRVSLPLSVCLSNACGSRVLPASVDVETALPHSFAQALYDPHCTLLILPCVRLLRAECICEGVFRVQLAISLEVYLLRYELCVCGSPKPSCPPLPLYPQPLC